MYYVLASQTRLETLDSALFVEMRKFAHGHDASDSGKACRIHTTDCPSASVEGGAQQAKELRLLSHFAIFTFRAEWRQPRHLFDMDRESVPHA